MQPRRHAGGGRRRRFREEPGLLLRRLGEVPQERCRPAPSSPAWTTRTTTAAGICGCRTAASARTSSTSGRKTPSRSCRASRVKPGQWNHVFVTYDGSGKAGRRQGVRQRRAAGNDRRGPTACGTPSARRCRSRSASATPRRASTDWSLQDLRLYGRTLSGLEVEQLAKGTRGGMAAGQAGRAAHSRRDEGAVRLVAGGAGHDLSGLDEEGSAICSARKRP